MPPSCSPCVRQQTSGAPHFKSAAHHVCSPPRSAAKGSGIYVHLLARSRAEPRAHHVAAGGLLVRVDKPAAHRVAHHRAQWRGYCRAALRLACWRRRCCARRGLPALRAPPRRRFLYRCFNDAIACRHSRLASACAATAVAWLPLRLTCRRHCDITGCPTRTVGTPPLRRRFACQCLRRTTSCKPQACCLLVAYTCSGPPRVICASRKHRHWGRRGREICTTSPPLWSAEKHPSLLMRLPSWQSCAVLLECGARPVPCFQRDTAALLCIPSAQFSNEASHNRALEPGERPG